MGEEGREGVVQDAEGGEVGGWEGFSGVVGEAAVALGGVLGGDVWGGEEGLAGWLSWRYARMAEGCWG